MSEVAPPRSEPRLRPTGPIVPRAEMVIWGEARAALAAARAYEAEARQWAEASRDAERQRGHAEGFAAGAQDAARLMARTAAQAADHLEALSRDLPALVYDLVADIVGDFEPGEGIARAVRHAVARLRPGAEAVLRVSPGEVEAVRGALDGLGGQVLRIEADPSLAPGESLLRSAFGSVELGIEAQLRALRAGLLGPKSLTETAP